MHELTQLIKKDMLPALGVTEPGAIAFCVAKARTYLGGELKHLNVGVKRGFTKMPFPAGPPLQRGGGVFSSLVVVWGGTRQGGGGLGGGGGGGRGWRRGGVGGKVCPWGVFFWGGLRGGEPTRRGE